MVEQAAPKEPPVHAMMGQIYQRVGNVQQAMLHLNIALDLDPKEANAIKVFTSHCYFLLQISHFYEFIVCS